jgi:NMD protein affecting ribosome stability and mRNA decay
MVFMDFCVKCGSKTLYKEHLCRKCYDLMNPAKVLKEKKKNVSTSSKHPGYFEAVIQLRNVKQNIIDFTFRSCAEHHIGVAKIKWLKNGVDLWVSDRRFSQRTLKELQKKFGGLVKTSATLFTQDKLTSKLVHRVTVLFKQFPFKKGEIFEFKGQSYTIVGIGKDIIAEDESGKKRTLRYIDLERARVF